MNWSWNIFGWVGYAGVALSLVVVVLWMVGLVRRSGPRPLLIATMFALLALVCAQVNSSFYVNRLEPDRSAVDAATRAAEEAMRQKKIAALDATREQAAADIRFAEDAKDDSLDKAGLDDADLQYLETIEEGVAGTDGTPAWKQKKKSRGEGNPSDDGLEAQLDTGRDAPAGMDSAKAEDAQSHQPIVVPEDVYAMAHRIDRWNLWWTRFLVVAAAAIVARNWLRRANDYARAWLPLPVPSYLVDAMRPLPSLFVRPRPPRRSMPDELAWLLRRGDSFLYLAGDSAATEAAADALAPLEERRRSVQVLRLGPHHKTCDDRFVFECLWYGRCSFLVDDPTRAERLVKNFCIFLEERQSTRARAPQTVHVVWDLSTATPSDQAAGAAFIDRWKRLLQALSWRGRRTGFSVFLCRDRESAQPTSKVESAA